MWVSLCFDTGCRYGASNQVLCAICVWTWLVYLLVCCWIAPCSLITSGLRVIACRMSPGYPTGRPNGRPWGIRETLLVYATVSIGTPRLVWFCVCDMCYWLVAIFPMHHLTWDTYVVYVECTSLAIRFFFLVFLVLIYTPPPSPIFPPPFPYPISFHYKSPLGLTPDSP